MLGQLLPNVELPLHLVLSTPIFFLFFIGIVWRAYSRKRKAAYEQVGHLPLDD